jgi:hypothetical protein
MQKSAANSFNEEIRRKTWTIVSKWFIINVWGCKPFLVQTQNGINGFLSMPSLFTNIMLLIRLFVKQQIISRSVGSDVDTTVLNGRSFFNNCNATINSKQFPMSLDNCFGVVHRQHLKVQAFSNSDTRVLSMDSPPFPPSFQASSCSSGSLWNDEWSSVRASEVTLKQLFRMGGVASNNCNATITSRKK